MQEELGSRAPLDLEDAAQHSRTSRPPQLATLAANTTAAPSTTTCSTIVAALQQQPLAQHVVDLAHAPQHSANRVTGGRHVQVWPAGVVHADGLLHRELPLLQAEAVKGAAASHCDSGLAGLEVVAVKVQEPE